MNIITLLTDMNVETRINDIVEVAKDYWHQINIAYIPLHKMLGTVVFNYSFIFNRRIYKRLFGGSTEYSVWTYVHRCAHKYRPPSMLQKLTQMTIAGNP